MREEVDLSVVIGFRDWGTDRLTVALNSIRDAADGLNLEIVVSDYGSVDLESNRELLGSLPGVKYVGTECDGPWSRSRALNLGLANASGKVLACTDADMIFTPGTFRRVFEVVASERNATVLIECRDLPVGWDHNAIRARGADWIEFDQVSTLRGRWGMGGMVAFSRATYVRTRGLDERMHTYGCEDIDFGERTQQAGNRIVWMDDPEVRMYHMWHPGSHDEASRTPEVRAAIEHNRAILYNDRSIARNLVNWGGRPVDAAPLVSVVIATRNRREFLADAIASVLAQTMSDFEIVVVDDGSREPYAQAIAEGLSDSRIRVHSLDHVGIAAARNEGTRLARGRYIAVLDDDDIMLPWRLERQVAAIHAGVHGSYGAYVNYDPVTGALTRFNEKNVSIASAYQSGGAPGHSTWMIERSLMLRIPYDEAIRTGEDNNLFLRMLRVGARFAHCAEFVAVRRTHAHQITKNDSRLHEAFATRNRYYLRFAAHCDARSEIESVGRAAEWVSPRGNDGIEELVGPYLPASENRMILRVGGLPTPELNALLSPELVVCRVEPMFAESFALLFGATLSTLALIRSKHRHAEVEVVSAMEAHSAQPVPTLVALQHIDRVLDVHGPRPRILIAVEEVTIPFEDMVAQLAKSRRVWQADNIVTGGSSDTGGTGVIVEVESLRDGLAVIRDLRKAVPGTSYVFAQEARADDSLVNALSQGARS